jgi:hypothetical protein
MRDRLQGLRRLRRLRLRLRRRLGRVLLDMDWLGLDQRLLTGNRGPALSVVGTSRLRRTPRPSYLH